ncbi:MAG: hypothetical protein WC758_00420 [Candidatus Woesearchaeota archaeon]|jgi:hypothetical protein
MKHKKIFVLTFLILLFLPLFVSAQSTGYGGTTDGLLGGTEKEIFKTVGNILSYKITIPVANLYTADPNLQDWTMPVWLLFAGFTVIFCVLWLASGVLPLFKADENKRSRTFFTIAITLITMFTTPVMMWILKLVTLFTTLSYIALLILGGFTVWTIFRSGWASNAVTNSESAKSMADARRNMADAAQKNAESGRQTAQTGEYMHKTAQALTTGLHQQIEAVQSVTRNLRDIVTVVVAIERRGVYPAATPMTDNLLRDMNNISQNLGRISSFKTQNDRLMSGMTTKYYSETAKGSIGSKSAAKKAVKGVSPAIPALIEIKAKSDAETNDLGRILSEMASNISAGIKSKAAADKIINLGSTGVNILQRMEKDIVLEEQMIEKI